MSLKPIPLQKDPIPMAQRGLCGDRHGERRNDGILDRIIDLVERIRQVQMPDGTIPEKRTETAALLTTVADLIERNHPDIGGLSPHQASATASDLRDWLAAGLDTPPAFDRTIHAFTVPTDASPVFLLACMRATNGPQPCGSFLEVIAGYRRESDGLTKAGKIADGYEKAFDCIHLTHASTGFGTGNSIVLFPESVATREPISRQPFALFFFNKFRSIYLTQTMPEVRRLFGTGDSLFANAQGWLSALMTEADMYDARCLWGYLHDYAHHTGPRPLDRSLHVKTRWHTGLLEELKCDLIAALVLERERPAHWREIIEFILWERILRYPLDHHDRNTFDAGSGVLLFHELHGSGAIEPETGGGLLKIDLNATLQTARRLVQAIEDLERLDDTAYPAAARQFIDDRFGPPAAPDRYDWRKTVHACVVKCPVHMQS